MNQRAFAVACFILGLVASEGGAQNQPPPLPQPPPRLAPVVTDCWTETQHFYSLKTGDLDYCRGHMKYVPGAPDCYTFEVKVCQIFDPTNNQWSQSRQPFPPQVFECQDEAKPPLCPSMPALRR